ncbi:MAG TPA: lytic transglycosylase domain-containing protein [Syntrophales bacterium]|jgi:soluble lytic murein transglycosylase-like protein|nr:lytic transglycosylase domain-containing protein [Syntrophorhabdaceae bacterium]HPX80381.1 lytic transglycosylase domain-containing protein [Syntrophales bacterium]
MPTHTDNQHQVNIAHGPGDHSARNVNRRRYLAALLLVCTLWWMPAVNASAFCFEEAGEAYGISPLLLWSIASVESSFNPAAINHNSNGSYDYGVMQINSNWFRVLGKEQWDRLADPCFNVHVGAWVLAQCIQRHGYTWKAVGCYNSSKPERRRAYAEKVLSHLKRAQDYAENKTIP